MKANELMIGDWVMFPNSIEKVQEISEVRFNDRNFQVYDVLHLQEWCGGEYTGREITADVTYILSDEQFVKEGYVVMSIKVICINS